jgi:hypothetical protein
MESLRAIKVNWSVDLSTPFLSLLAIENSGIEILFGADFGPHTREQNYLKKSDKTGFQEISIVDRPSDLDEVDFSRYQYQKVKIVFDNFYGVKMLSSQTDFSVIGYKNYDFTQIMFFDLLCQDSELWAERFYSYWEKTNICPDPRMYEVGNSRWLNETNASRFGCKHFTILGHDNYVEVLANNWN